jgi:hypothetical protein
MNRSQLQELESFKAPNKVGKKVFEVDLELRFEVPTSQLPQRR